MRYECEYKLSERFGSWSHNYTVVCRRGAITFHVSEPPPGADYESSGGLESHWREPPEYMAEDAPSHSPCPFLGQPCWHDGTSLYASEVLIPRWQRRQSEKEVFEWLKHECSRLDPPGSEDE